MKRKHRMGLNELREIESDSDTAGYFHIILLILFILTITIGNILL